ncbi:MAG TPA: non-homologous end-joining DNA ligase [Acidimicrobiales bacterium]|nr:non-homologous end-joining DNA ligase [Acidimicrobiales bacterium]
MPVVEIDGRELSVTNLDKVLYPDGFTKAEVIDYYVRVAPAMLPHVQGRGVTLRRYPNGVDGTSFFEKRSPDHRPDWIGTALGPGDRKGGIQYLVIDEVATLAWVGNMAALEVHAPMARAVDIDAPTMVVFDLDPGAPATIVDCCRVALEIQEVLADLELQIWPKTSGSKGMQLYLPLNTPHTHEHASSFALAVAQVLENQDPKRVTSVMKKQLRKGKIFVDWSQNSHHKTTIAAYSLRARPTPTVSTPISWDEVQSGADGEVLSFTAPEVLERVADFGDVFAPTATLEQELPTPRS